MSAPAAQMQSTVYQQLQILTAAKDLRAFANAAKVLQTKPTADIEVLLVNSGSVHAWANGLRLLSIVAATGYGGSILDTPVATLTLLNALGQAAVAWLQTLITMGRLPPDQSHSGAPQSITAINVQTAQKMTEAGKGRLIRVVVRPGSYV